MKLFVLTLFAVSGCVSLIYEVVWRRMLSLMVGGSVWATAMVLAAFMGGLALGAAVLGRKSDRWQNPLAAYGLIEGMIGLWGLAFLLAVPALRSIYAGIAAATNGSLLVANLIKAPLVLFVLLPPTFLMGATFPVLARFYVAREHSVGKGIGDLYFANTAGAVLGTVLAGFVLIRAAGVRWTNLIAIGLSFAVGLIALGVSRKTGAVAVAQPVSPARERKRASRISFSLPISFALAASGFAALAYEVLWTRILVYLVGNSTYSFTVMLSGFLIGIALGAGLFRAFERFLRSPLAASAVQIGIGFVALLLLSLSSHPYGLWQRLFAGASEQPAAAFLLVRWYILVLLALLPTTILVGISFPLLTRLYVGDAAAMGKGVGAAYAFNTLGAVLGSLAAVFVLLPMLGIGGAIVAAAFVNIAAGIALLLAHGGMRLSRRFILAACVLAVFLFRTVGRDVQTEVGRWMDGKAGKRGEMLFYREGVSSTVAVFRATEGTPRKILQTDGVGQVPTDLDAMQVFKLLGHLPFLAHPEAKSVLVTAFGGGITAGAILAHSVERMDVVEICPDVLDASQLFREENRNALSDPRLSIFLTDANEFVRWTPQRYDAIVSDSTHPGAAESWVLYTRDFYRACRDRLNRGGVMCQWVPLHHLATEDFRTILRTFQSVFPHTTLWFARGYTVLLATEQPLRVEPAQWRSLLRENPTVAGDLALVNLDSVGAILKNLLLDERAVAGFAGEGPVATEDLSPLEFASLHAYGVKSSPLTQAAIHKVLPRDFGQIVLAATDDQEVRAAATARAHYLDGVRAFKADEGRQALAAFREAASLMPGDRDVRVYLRWAAEESAKQYLAAEHLDAREPELQQLASQFPESAILQMAWGLAIIAQAGKADRPEDAKPGIALLRKAVAMAPDDLYVLDIVGQACLNMRAYPVAVSLLENLSRQQPDNPAVLCNLARAYAGLGRTDQARETLERALRIAPNHAGCRALLEELDSPLKKSPSSP